MDYIVKLSDLASEYSHIREKVGGSELIVNNQTMGENVNWRSFYDTSETLENVSRVYAEDIRVLDYAEKGVS